MTYQSEVLADAPWGYWRCQETSGTSLADASPNARALTINGSPTLNQPGPFTGSTAISWTDVANQYAGSAATVSTSDATLEAWIYLTAYPTSLTPIIGCSAGYGGSTFDKDLGVESSGGLRLHIYSGSTQSILSPPISLNSWHHVIVSVGAAGMKMRVDKQTISTAAITSSYTGAQNVYVRGGGYDPSGDHYTGTSPIIIAEPALYTAQLTDVRTDAHFDAASGAMTPPSFTGTWGIEF